MTTDELDLAVVNGTVVLGHGRYRLAIGVKDGKVVANSDNEEGEPDIHYRWAK